MSRKIDCVLEFPPKLALLVVVAPSKAFVAVAAAAAAAAVVVADDACEALASASVVLPGASHKEEAVDDR